MKLSYTASLFLLLTACTRPPISRGPVETTPRAPAVTQDAPPVQPVTAGESEIPAFLRSQRPSFVPSRQATIGGEPLTVTQFNDRPWLWGQTSSTGEFPNIEDPSVIAEVDRGRPEDRVRAIAERYLSWFRVDDELHWAPMLCRLPQPSMPTLGSGQAPHGRKVYFLYARARRHFLENEAQPLQVVVKEAWVPHEVEREQAVRVSMGTVSTPGEGTTLEPGTFAGLYVMFRATPDSPPAQSDHGWLYGTITPNGTVTAGRITSCMNCHINAPHDRLFGLPANRPNRM